VPDRAQAIRRTEKLYEQQSCVGACVGVGQQIARQAKSYGNAAKGDWSEDAAISPRGILAEANSGGPVLLEYSQSHGRLSKSCTADVKLKPSTTRCSNHLHDPLDHQAAEARVSTYFGAKRPIEPEWRGKAEHCTWRPRPHRREKFRKPLWSSPVHSGLGVLS
jgi:hypothetical protein